MELYRQSIKDISSLLPDKYSKKWKCNPAKAFPEGDKNAIILRSDTAFELGGGGLSAVCAVMFDESIGGQDEIILYGEDLTAIDKDVPFAHFSFVGMKTDKNGEYQYKEIKNTEFSIYKIHPDGYSIRISPSENREQVRVSKTAVVKGISFENIGNSLIKEFKKNPGVQYVKTVFVTLNDFDYKTAYRLAQKVSKITSAIDTSLSIGNVDCNSCAMKAICDEVEGLRELHFKQSEERK